MKNLLFTETYATANLMRQQAKNMETPENKSPEIESKPKFLPTKFIHEKSAQFRTYHTNGQWLLVNSLSEILVNFFIEHPQIATGVINEVTPDRGIYTDKIKILGVDETENQLVTRDFQCCVVLSISGAERLQKALGTFIAIAKKNEADMKARLEQNK